MTKTVSYRGLLLGLLALGVVGMLASGATIAFYGDVERSTGNTFTAGGVELLVDSVSHYNNMICVDTDDDGQGDQWQPYDGFTPEVGHYPATGSACDGTWELTDLEEGVHKFFNFADLKPGDFGEDTISLHVFTNPAWGRLSIENVVDRDNDCTEPEQTAEAGNCVAPNGDGELDNYLEFTAWVDHGTVPGFQCENPGASSTGAGCEADPGEGDNLYQETEIFIIQDEPLADFDSFEFAPALAAAYDTFGCTQSDGDTGFDDCHGLAEDGRMVPTAVYYIGLAWQLPLLATGNDAQTDSLEADMIFEVEQHRNNPNPFGGPVTGGPGPLPPSAQVVIDTSPLTTVAGTQLNFVATVVADAGFDGSNTVITVDDTGAGGEFFDGTIAGACNNVTPDADNEFAISTNKGICYSNATAGTYTVTVTLLDQTGGSTVGTPVDITVTVN